MTDLMDRIRHCVAYAPRFGDNGSPHGLRALLDEAEEVGGEEVIAAVQALRTHYRI